MEKQVRSHRRTPANREDWWSEDATETLIAAWGDRYVKLNRGNLRQKDWTEVADAVNSRHGNDGRPKTDVQCKNRIDTLKKKHKAEKAKQSPSTWRFFDRLDSLIVPLSKKPQSSSAAGTVKSAPANRNPNQSGPNSTDSSLDDDDSDDEGEEWGFVARKHRRVEESDLSDGLARGELADAMLKFGEIYERIESAKQKVLIELEKERMEMTKEVELQRMKMLMEMQLEIQNSKNRKFDSTSGKKMT